MKGKQNIPVITDGLESTGKMAALIALQIAALGEGYSTRIIEASQVSGADLLPSRVFFIGCDSPEPASFGYLDVFLRHVNFAGRSCGLFSPSSDTAASYLNALIKDCEAFSAEIPPGSGLDEEALNARIKDWIQKVLAPVKIA